MVKYIVAGYHKTGTKSLSAAFRSLGLRVYDAPEVHLFMRRTWIDFLAGKITIEEVAQEYEDQNVDVIVDSPGFFFWKEFHKIWPKAKVILTERDSTDVWWNSAKNFFNNLNQWAPCKYGWFFNYLSPTAYSTLVHLTYPTMYMIHGTLKMYVQHADLDNPSVRNIMITRYEAHNAYVKSHADERFLIYNVKKGWAPLCEFMGIPIIAGPIPHHNQSKNQKDTKEFMDDMMTPFVDQCKKEIYITLIAIIVGQIGMALAIAFIVKDQV